MSIGRWVGALIVVSAVAACGGGASATSTAGSASTASKSTARTSVGRATSAGAAPSTTAVGSARAALAALPVKGRAPMTGYSREQFGDGWRPSAAATRATGSCAATSRGSPTSHGERRVRSRSGRLNDPYTAAAITFVRGGASEVDIDHVVALGDAWQKGAQQWTRGQRVALANDPLNLLSVDAQRQPPEGRRRRGDVAAVQQGVPLPLRRPADRGQAQVPGVGHPGRARCDGASSLHLPAPAPARPDAFASA